MVADQLDKVISRISWDSPTGSVTCQSWGIQSRLELENEIADFNRALKDAFATARQGHTTSERNPLFHRLRRAFVDKGVDGVGTALKQALMFQVVQHPTTESIEHNQKKLADLRYPTEWYPATRALQRTIHLHVGPTNSGKTYQALKKLEAAKTGVYAGPLRLLAHEVYTRMNAKGKKCALVTGEERRIPENMTDLMSSCTVEMVPLNAKVDVAVIDEIQMMADPERGWAWTSALLGVQAKEVHLCGELRVIPLIKSLCTLMGDKLVIHKYERLSPLKAQAVSLSGNLKRLEKGDAIISFSRLDIHAMKKRVELITKKRCAVVYGSLPPETRAQQAALFNDPDNDYDFLAASDAIGMGLNLSIKRIIFEKSEKFDGHSVKPLEVPALRQIAGRAGRYKSARDAIIQGSTATTESDTSTVLPEAVKSTNAGNVTTLHAADLPFVTRSMAQEPEPLKACGIFPPDNILSAFASYFPPTTPFSYILSRLHDISTVSHGMFVLSSMKDQLPIADIIQSIDLTLEERIAFVKAPVQINNPEAVSVVQELASCLANHSSGHILDLKTLDLGLLQSGINDIRGGSTEYLRKAESLHKSITLYLWLSYRFDGAFVSQALAFHIKDLVEKKIDECLESASVLDRRVQSKTRRIRAAEQARQEAELRSQLEEDDTENIPEAESSLESDPETVDLEGEDQPAAYDLSTPEPVSLAKFMGKTTAVPSELLENEVIQDSARV